MDALAFEPQFLDHLAPVWRLLPPSHRGRFLVAPTLVDRARAKGIDAVAQPRPPHTVLQPKPNPGYNPALVASYGDIKEARRLGYGPFAFLEHGAGQTYDGETPNVQGHASYSGGRDRDDNELFLVPNAHAADRWRRAYPKAQVAIVGCPKLDDLPRREPGPGPVVALAFHWPAPISISGYAGTALADYLPVLPSLAVAFPGRVIGHAHPKADWPERMERHYRRAGIPFVADFEDVCRQADVYVCDNSSTIFEFAATGRPVVVLNARNWSPKLSHGLRFETSPGCPLNGGLHFCGAAHVGVQVGKPDDLIAAIERALRNDTGDQEARDHAVGMVYPVTVGGAQLAAAAITSWIDGQAAIAA